ncbi:hypothetical protein AVEN_88599-1 [Araneus ventricosus]|uniref:Uncharacterized protein n=1 Tax=Araneus ventricosus TaxID=182803 RepID=A0A4Y2FR15_ARAVE|nr:hypothetical protein AVEN_88599-1 [Araneus ventricosus]
MKESSTYHQFWSVVGLRVPQTGEIEKKFTFENGALISWNLGQLFEEISANFWSKLRENQQFSNLEAPTFFSRTIHVYNVVLRQERNAPMRIFFFTSSYLSR